MALLGIANFCGQSNFSGLLKIEYAPTNWIDQNSYEPILTSSGNWNYNILFTSGDWLTAYVIPNNQFWEEQQQDSRFGDFYEQTVQGIAPNLRPAVSFELDQMKEYDFLLKLTDRNNQPWILGSLDFPFRFRHQNSSGNGTDLNAYSIQFFSQTPRKAAGFKPSINI